MGVCASLCQEEEHHTDLDTIPRRTNLKLREYFIFDSDNCVTTLSYNSSIREYNFTRDDLVMLVDTMKAVEVLVGDTIYTIGLSKIVIVCFVISLSPRHL